MVLSLSLPVIPSSADRVSDTQGTAVAKNFASACEGCGELPLVQCNLNIPRGALEEKKFICERLAERLTVEQVTALLEKKYGHRISQYGIGCFIKRGKQTRLDY